MSTKSNSSEIELSDSTKEKEDELEPEFDSLGQIWRNTLVLSITFLVLFTAFSPLQDLQSSLFREEGMGTTVLAVLYCFFVLSSLFVPSSMIDTLGCKWTLVISIMCYIMYMAVHFYASWGLLIPAAIINGIGAAPLWSSKCHYLNNLAHDYAKKKGITNDAATNLFFGVFFLFMCSSGIWGSIISSLVLSPVDSNNSVAALSDKELALCGKAFCPQFAETNNTNLARPPQGKIYLLAGIYTACACLAVIIAIALLQQLPAERGKKIRCTKATCKPKILVATALQLRDYRQLLLIPITMFSGLQFAFLSADYTQAFIACPLGNWWVGYALISFSTVSSACAFLFGNIAKYVGRFPFFILAALTNASVAVTLLHFNITQDRVYIYLVFSGLWGMADSVWKTQLSSIYGVVFKENSEAAFSNNSLWKSVGFIFPLAYQNHLCMPTKLYILLANLALGMIGYCIVEYTEWRKRRN